VDKESLLAVLKSEIERSTGCTDPGAVCLAVSRATRELGCLPERVVVTVSPNVFKNGISVGVPGTGARGLPIAAALGAVLDKCEAGLAILDYATPEKIAAATKLVAAGRVQVRYADALDPLYIEAQVFAGVERASVVIANDYSNIVEIARNGTVLFSSSSKKAEVVQDALAGCTLQALFGLIETLPVADLEFLLDAAEVNRRAAQTGLANPMMKLGRVFQSRAAGLPEELAAINTAQMWTAAAGEARMSGLPVPIIAITGSGNHGITNFLGVLAVAETLGSSRQQLARALAISSTVTVVIKGHVKRMTAFCGCAVAASTGVAAGTVYLLGGSYAEMVNAMQSVIGTLAGMLCDGAKESCAYKLSAATTLAIQFAYAACQGAYIPAGMGVVGKTIEKTFVNLGLLNNPGMTETDRFVLELIQDNV
jgi:L-cysteine desulfidase